MLASPRTTGALRHAVGTDVVAVRSSEAFGIYGSNKLEFLTEFDNTVLEDIGSSLLCHRSEDAVPLNRNFFQIATLQIKKPT